MVYIKLFLSFFKIGMMSFGGGYTMIPLIQQELEVNGWMTSEKFHDLIAISEITPGSVSINSATFIGYEIGGFFGSLIATLGIILPSLILILLISTIIMKKEGSSYYESALNYIRPVVAGLILSASFFVAETSIFADKITLKVIPDTLLHPNKFINIKAMIMFMLILVLLKKRKLHPILLMAVSGLFGILLFYIL